MEYTLETSNTIICRLYTNEEYIPYIINYTYLCSLSKKLKEDIRLYGDSGEAVLTIGKGHNIE